MLGLGIASCLLLSVVVAIGIATAIIQRREEVPASAKLGNETDRPAVAHYDNEGKRASLPQSKSVAPTVAPELADIVEKIEPAVVRIVTDIAVGSGIVIDSRGRVVTNYHVVEGASEAKVEFRGGTNVEVSGYVALDRSRDLAILSLAGENKKFPAIPLAANLPRKAERVVALGAPLGLSFSASEGIVSAVRTGKEVRELLGATTSDDGGLEPSANWIQTTAAISKGNSGGPLVNMKGELIGLNTWHLVDGQSLNFAIAATDVKQLLTKADRKPMPLANIAPGDRADDAAQEAQLRSAAPGRFETADPGDRQRAIEALKRLDAGVDLTTDEARAILEFGEPLRKKVAENLARTADARERERQAALTLFTSYDRWLLSETEKQIKSSPLEGLSPFYLDFALGAGREALYDTVRDAALDNPGPVTSEVSKLLHFSQQRRLHFALEFADALRHPGEGYYLLRICTPEIARILAKRERLLTDQELSFAKKVPFLDDALAEYARHASRPEVQAEVAKSKAAKAAAQPEKLEAFIRAHEEEIKALQAELERDEKEIKKLEPAIPKLKAAVGKKKQQRRNASGAQKTVDNATSKLEALKQSRSQAAFKIHSLQQEIDYRRSTNGAGLE